MKSIKKFQKQNKSKYKAYYVIKLCPQTVECLLEGFQSGDLILRLTILVKRLQIMIDNNKIENYYCYYTHIIF